MYEASRGMLERFFRGIFNLHEVVSKIAVLRGFRFDVPGSLPSGNVRCFLFSWHSFDATCASASVWTGPILLNRAEAAWDSHVGWERLWNQRLLPAAQRGQGSLREFEPDPDAWFCRFFPGLNKESIEGLLQRRGLQILKSSNQTYTRHRHRSQVGFLIGELCWN